MAAEHPRKLEAKDGDPRLIVALDLPDAVSGLDLADRIGAAVSFY